MTLEARLLKIQKSLNIYRDPNSSPEQKQAAGLAITRLQTNLPPDFWVQQLEMPPGPTADPPRRAKARRGSPIRETAPIPQHSMVDDFVRRCGDIVINEFERRLRRWSPR